MNSKRKSKLKSTLEYQMSLIVPSNNVEEVTDYKDLKNPVDKTLMYLPERRREGFELSRIKGLSHKEIAEELGISTKIVENHLNLALHHFRDPLQKTNALCYAFVLLSFL